MTDSKRKISFHCVPCGRKFWGQNVACPSSLCGLHNPDEDKIMPRIPRKEQFAILRKMMTVMIVHDDEWCDYIEGWDEKRLAKEFGVTLDTVTHIRHDAFGKIKNPKDNAVSKNLTVRVDNNIEKVLRELPEFMDLMREFVKEWGNPKPKE